MDRGTERYDQTDGYETGIAGEKAKWRRPLVEADIYGLIRNFLLLVSVPLGVVTVIKPLVAP